MQRADKRSQYWLRALPRFLLSLLLGAVVSTPFTLQIFQPEIRAEVARIHAKNLDSFIAQQQNGDLGRKTSKDRNDLQKLQDAINTAGGNQGPSASVTALLSQQDAHQTAAQKAYDDWQCQLYGGPKCRAAGFGPVAKAAEQRYRAAQRQVENDAKKIRAAQGNDLAGRTAAVSNAESNKAAAQQKVADDEARLKAELAAFTKENEADNGLLIQIRALDQVTAKNDTLIAARILLFLLFMVVEILPVMTKIFINLNPKSRYEEAVESADEMQLDLSRDEARNARTLRNKELSALEQVWDQVALETAEAELRITRARLQAREDRAHGLSRRRWVRIRLFGRRAFRHRPRGSAMRRASLNGSGAWDLSRAVMQEPSSWTKPSEGGP